LTGIMNAIILIKKPRNQVLQSNRPG